jgi:hypothetical protein
MKRLLALIIICLFIMGCGATGTYSYKSWDHLMFSAVGYKECSQADIEKAKKEGWDGELVPCPVKK